MFCKSILTATFAVLSAAGVGSAAVINFDDGLVAVGTVMSTQYVPLCGATFSSGLGGATGIAAPAAGFGSFGATTDMTVVSFTGTDVGGGIAAPMSGLLLRSFNGWLGETGDPAISLTFASPVSAISITFGGVSDVASSRIIAVSAANAALSSVATTATGTSTITLTPATAVSNFVITPGDYNDWVGIDNITFTTAIVPEPASLAPLAGATVLLARRRRA